MAAATRASNGFKKKCGEFREELDTLEAQLETTASENAALQIKHQTNHYMHEKWEKISTCFDELEDRHPEAPPEHQVDANPVPSERQNLYNTLRREFMNTKIRAIHKVSELREAQAIPVPVQPLQLTPAWLARKKKLDREKVVAMLKRKLQLLKNEVDAFVISKCEVELSGLKSVYIEVKCLWKSS